VLVATTAKNVERLGERTALPVEIVRFGRRQTARRLQNLGFSPELRMSAPGDEPFVSDNGSFILDCATGPMEEPGSVAKAVKTVPGVVEHGLFLGIALAAVQVAPDGEVLTRSRA
jgi:ribose 5-phosphate isomerase A